MERVGVRRKGNKRGETRELRKKVTTNLANNAEEENQGHHSTVPVNSLITN